MPSRTRRVALIYDAKLPYDLKVISGIARYVQEGAELNIYIEEDALKSQRLPASMIPESPPPSLAPGFPSWALAAAMVGTLVNRRSRIFSVIRRR